MTRLEKLRALRDRVDEEIAREEAAAGTPRIVVPLHPMVQHILDTTAAAHGVGVADLLTHRRTRDIDEARHVAAWLLRESGKSYPQIGRIFDRHHTASLNSVRRVNTDPMLLDTARRLLATIGEVAA